MRWVLVVVASLSVVVAALAAPGDPRRDLNAADQARARSLVLQRSDLPARSWRVTPTDFSQPNPPCFVRDYSLSALTLNGQAGFTYEAGASFLDGVLVESDGAVFRTAAQARQAFAKLADEGLGRCLGASFVAGLRAAGASAALVRTGLSRRVVSGIPAADLRIVLHVSTARGQTTLELVQIELVRGRAVASLALIRRLGTGSPDVRSLEGRIATRLKAA